MNMLKIFLISLIQGITEFLPISSTAHIKILSKYINLDKNSFEIFFIVSQIATTLSVIIYFKSKILDILLNFFKKQETRNFIYNIIISYFPITIIGFIFHSYIKYLHKNYIMSLSLILGGLFFLYVEKLIKNKDIKIKYKSYEDINKITALKIGLSQILAIVPGVSRSGSTIITSLFIGLNRELSVNYSFFLSIPTTISSLSYDIYKNYDIIKSIDFKLMLFSFLSTFIISIIAIKIFISYIKKHNFNIFGWYRIIIGFLLLSFSNFL